MAVKLTIDDPVEVIGPLREEYRKGADGKFHLVLDRPHPDSAKLSEFRDNNIALLKEVSDLRPLKARYEGIDADAARTALARTGELEKANADLTAKLATYDGVDPEEFRVLKQRPDPTALASELETERRAHAATILRNAVTVEFLRLGGRESAIDYIVDAAAKTFAVEDGKLTTKEFSSDKLGEQLSLTEWVCKQKDVADFTFKPSNGGGTKPQNPNTRRLGASANAKELVNPTPHQLGEHMSAIASGKLKVVYTE
jgi:hypothetical protein